MALAAQSIPLEAVELTARRLVAAALSTALRDPLTLPGGALVAHPGAVVAAWELVGACHAGVRQADLGLGEIVPSAADPRPLALWLQLGRVERERVSQRVFGLIVSKECPPYETEFCASQDSFFRAQHMADIAGFYRAFGVEPGGDSPDRVDHVSTVLEFVAFLLEKLGVLAAGVEGPAELEHRQTCEAALGSFVRDHVIWWMPTFARCLERRVEKLVAGEADPVAADRLRLLAGVGGVLRAWVAAERLWAGLEPARRLVAPAVAGPSTDEGGCHTCDSQGGACGGAGGGGAPRDLGTPPS